MVAPTRRVAVLGGDGRFDPDRIPGADIRVYKARRYGGNGELRRLEAAIRQGGIDLVVVLTRWNCHSVTQKILGLCRRIGVKVEMWA